MHEILFDFLNLVKNCAAKIETYQYFVSNKKKKSEYLGIKVFLHYTTKTKTSWKISRRYQSQDHSKI